MIDLFQGKLPKESFTTKSLSSIHEFYLTGQMLAPENYIDWFDVIRNATELDVVKIYINSPGGDVATAIQFRRALMDFPGTVIASIEGECMSAATMIMLSADNFEISPHSMFMFHNYSGGAIGKGGELYDRLSYEREWSHRLLKDIYMYFLTDSEIDDMLEGKDIWLDTDEVQDRLESRAEAYKLDAEEELEEEENE